MLSVAGGCGVLRLPLLDSSCLPPAEGLHIFTHLDTYHIATQSRTQGREQPEDSSSQSVVQLMGAWGDLSRRLQHIADQEDASSSSSGDGGGSGEAVAAERSGNEASTSGSGGHPSSHHHKQQHLHHHQKHVHLNRHHHQHHQQRSHPANGGSSSSSSSGLSSGLVLEALKMALRVLARLPPRRDGRTPAERAVGLAAALADLAVAGAPLDGPCIAAGIVADAVGFALLGGG